jgi:hypothetical protein
MSKNFRADLLQAGLLESDAPSSQPQPPLAYPIEDVPARTGIPRTKVFDAIRKKELMRGRRVGQPLSNIQSSFDTSKRCRPKAVSSRRLRQAPHHQNTTGRKKGGHRRLMASSAFRLPLCPAALTRRSALA